MDGEWEPGKHCPGGWIETVFTGALGYDLITAQEKCAAACNERSDCFFADLFWDTNWHTCYLKDNGCGDWQTNEHPSYHIYIKGICFNEYLVHLRSLYKNTCKYCMF